MPVSPRGWAPPFDLLSGACRLVLLPTLLVFLFAADASARDGELAVPTTDGEVVASGAPEAPLKHRFTVVESENRRFMGSGGRSRLRVVIRNDGDLVWTPDRPLRLSCRWRRVGSKRWEWGNRTELPARVAPGATVEVAAKMRAPKKSGVFIVQWDMVEKGVGWFSATDATPAPEHMVVVLPLQTLPFWILLSTMTAIAVIARSCGVVHQAELGACFRRMAAQDDGTVVFLGHIDSVRPPRRAHTATRATVGHVGNQCPAVGAAVRGRGLHEVLPRPPVLRRPWRR